MEGPPYPGANVINQELFSSRRRCTAGSAQKSNMYGMLPCTWCILFRDCHKHNSLPLGPKHPSSHSTKELHALTHFKYHSKALIGLKSSCDLPSPIRGLYFNTYGTLNLVFGLGRIACPLI